MREYEMHMDIASPLFPLMIRPLTQISELVLAVFYVSKLMESLARKHRRPTRLHFPVLHQPEPSDPRCSFRHLRKATTFYVDGVGGQLSARRI